jgi:hypothetical protein
MCIRDSIKADLQNYWTPTYDANAKLNVQNARRQNHADRANSQSAQSDMTFTLAETQSQSQPTVRTATPEMRERARAVGRAIERERAASAPTSLVDDLVSAVTPRFGSYTRWR